MDGRDMTCKDLCEGDGKTVACAECCTLPGLGIAEEMESEWTCPWGKVDLKYIKE